MGRIKQYQISRILRRVKYALLRLITYKYRRPIFLVNAIVGLIGYYYFAMSRVMYDTPNMYLLWFGEAIILIFNTINSIAFSNIIYGVIIIAMIIMVVGYCRQNDEEYDEDKENKKQHKINNVYKPVNIYKNINIAISLSI